MVRTRFAPSPTGYVHIGSIYSVLLDYAFAKKHSGTFILRIEDTDQKRLVADAEEAIYKALDWFSLTEDESPRKNGQFAPYRQSERLDIYKNYVRELVEKGHAYYCFCTPERLDQVRKDMQAQGKPPMYDKHCRNIPIDEAKSRIDKGEPYVVRLKVPENTDIEVEDLIRGKIVFPSKDVDDQVLLKSDGFPTYHLAAVVDDHLMEITHIVRGEEWLPSSPKHKLLYDMFGWQMPVLFHTPTLRNPDKSKLSKRKGHTDVRWYQEQGFLPEAIVNYISLLGWTHPEEKEIFNLDEFIRLFDLKDVSPAGPVFDEIKLKWMNGKYIREIIPDDELVQRILEYLKKYSNQINLSSIKLPGDIPLYSTEGLKTVLPLIKERIEVLADIPQMLKFLDPSVTVPLDEVKRQTKKTPEEIKTLLEELRTGLENMQPWTVQSIEEVVRTLKGKHEDWKPRDYFMTVRVATTAFPVTPPLFESMEVLGRELVLNRINSVINRL